MEHWDLKVSKPKREAVQVNEWHRKDVLHVHRIRLSPQLEVVGSSNSKRRARLWVSMSVRELIGVVLLLDKYIKHLPSKAEKKNVFYMKPKSEPPDDPSTPWYCNIPIGRNVLATMMKKMAEEAGLQKGMQAISKE